MLKMPNRKTDPVEILKADHKKVKQLFDLFEETEDRKEKTRIAEEAIVELKVHMALEEELFYPAARRKINDPEEMMNEAEEEHHVVKLLIGELESMDGEKGHFDAKFTVLAENVRHHIKEEEGEMFPKAQKTHLDPQKLGQKMADRKEQLMAEGVPTNGKSGEDEKNGSSKDSLEMADAHSASR